MITCWNRRLLLIACLICFCGCGVPRSVHGQPRSSETPAELLLSFQRDPTYSHLVWVLATADRYNSGFITELLDGLERIATTGTDEALRNSALTAMAVAGRPTHPVPASSVIVRFMRIYEQSSEHSIRENLLQLIPTVVGNEQALPLLEQVARSSGDTPPFPGAAADAVRSLFRAGPRGQQLLRDLKASNSVRDRNAAETLTALLALPPSR